MRIKYPNSTAERSLGLLKVPSQPRDKTAKTTGLLDGNNKCNGTLGDHQNCALNFTRKITLPCCPTEALEKHY